jgi:hypothetical protein
MKKGLYLSKMSSCHFGNLYSFSVFSWVCIAQSLVFCVSFCRPFFVFEKLVGSFVATILASGVATYIEQECNRRGKWTAYQVSLEFVLQSFHVITDWNNNYISECLYRSIFMFLCSVFSWVCIAQSLVFCVSFCRPFFVLFSWPWYCLYFFNLRYLIISLISSNSICLVAKLIAASIW